MIAKKVVGLDRSVISKNVQNTKIGDMHNWIGLESCITEIVGNTNFGNIDREVFASPSQSHCTIHQVHLILDEVATGFGRTGRMFALEHAGISPDFLCLSKGLTAGYMSMAATITTDDVYNSFIGNNRSDIRYPGSEF